MDAAESMAEGAQPSPPVPVESLSVREIEVLAFERQWWKYAGAKEQAIRELFDFNPEKRTPFLLLPYFWAKLPRKCWR